MFQIETPGVLKWLFGLSWTRYDEYEKYWMSLSISQTRFKISGFVYFLIEILRIDCDSVKINYFPVSQYLRFGLNNLYFALPPRKNRL
jgi:hypothetical protein